MIGAGAFQHTSLQTIAIPASVEKMGWNVFAGAENLKQVTFETGSHLKSIEFAAFSGATALETIDIPPSVTTIGPAAFSGATALETINIPPSVTNIDERAFSGATNLKQVTFLPGSNISLIEESVFADTNLKLVVMGKPVLDKLNTTIINNNAKLRFGDGNTFYGADNVSITSRADQAYSFLNVARQRGVPLDAARLSASFLTGQTPKAGPKGGRKRATRKGGRRRSTKKKAPRRRKTSRRKAR
jgi:hypothetical protein